MSYGIKVSRPDGSMFLTSSMPSYAFVGAFYPSQWADGKIRVPARGSLPPLVFSRVEASSHPAAVVPAIIDLVGSTWEITVGVLSVAVSANSVSTSVTWATVKAYVFMPEPSHTTGWGIKVTDPSGAQFSMGVGGKPPLVIAKRVFLDENTVSKAISPSPAPGYGRSVAISAPRGSWAAALGWGPDVQLSKNGIVGSMFNLSRRLQDSSGRFIAGIPPNLYVAQTTNVVTSMHGNWAGPEDSRDEKRPEYVPAALIDTWVYD